ncbi:carbon-nitrogen hydrolase family protein [Flavobacterium agricola]|uniref:Carbon-nitrogen hydrolase family protein n=1 Tax=Flavobacterium agricola TaxID=2870839 RepID=A0ABY6LYR8_9FLAO|nr:carbon-nitrogen hydrolase family protein [Flavobacterium agricola]UYW01379.1 carbon-nitrogen hydrolase family protein [Flavobacterium agricola]
MSTLLHKKIKVAAVDFIPKWGSFNENLTNLVDAVSEVAKQNVDYAVFPETILSGYLFTDSNEMAPYFDTIPGKTTEALLPLVKKHNMYISVGIAERDIENNVPYNSAVLLGPEGIVGVYRKNGLNSQDQKVFAPGNTGIPVFDTALGKIGLLICYDDTYWQYARLAMLQGAQIIGWHSVSDRIMPGSSKAELIGDHSTVSHVQHMSALNGVFTICATRTGIETNPLTKKQLYYNGGSSIWNPMGQKIAQAPIVGPEELPYGLHGVYTAIIQLEEAAVRQQQILKKRKTDLYNPLLSFHRSPTDANATTTTCTTSLKAVQWLTNESKLAGVKVAKNEILVLPELSALPHTNTINAILNAAESQNGPFEQQLCAIAKAGAGYVVGSYPEKDADKVYHTVVLAGPDGSVLARYRATHLNERDLGWATPGNEVSVTSTPIGRIALAVAYELEITELGGMYAALRADVLAAPAGLPHPLKVQIDANLYSIKNPPTNKADYYPYAAATLNQMWVICGGRREGAFTSAAIYGPEPVVLTETLLAAENEDAVQLTSTIPAPYSWLNQERLITGQVAALFPPIVKK